MPPYENEAPKSDIFCNQIHADFIVSQNSTNIYSGSNTGASVFIENNIIGTISPTSTDREDMVLDCSKCIIGRSGALKDVHCNDLSCSSVMLTALDVNNGSSTNASDGDVLTVSGGSMSWSQPSVPSASLDCASFALIGNTASLNAGGYFPINGTYAQLAGVVGNPITNNDNGTFTIFSSGVYLILYTLGAEHII